MNTTKALARIERDVFDAENFEQIDDQIGTVTGGHKTSSGESLPVKKTASCSLLKRKPDAIERNEAHGPFSSLLEKNGALSDCVVSASAPWFNQLAAPLLHRVRDIDVVEPFDVRIYQLLANFLR